MTLKEKIIQTMINEEEHGNIETCTTRDGYTFVHVSYVITEKDFEDVKTKMMIGNLVSNYIAALRFSVEIRKVIFNDPATIVLWTDGTKTVVRAENEEYDPEKGLAMAIAKKSLGNKGYYYETFKKWLPEAVVDEDNAAKEAVKAIRKLGQAVGQGLRDGLLGEEKEDENNDSN